MSRFMTKSQFDDLLANDRYWIKRWEYISEVINIIKEYDIDMVLELGPYNSKVINDSDVMDIRNHGVGLDYMMDARSLPWPINDKHYDLFVALEVWEHLVGCSRADVFREVMRISRMAVLIFPYLWDWVDKDNPHYMVDKETISKWTDHVEPELIKIVNKRIIYFFIFKEGYKDGKRKRIDD